MDKEILEKLNNKEFARKIINLSSEEEVIKAFLDEGVEVTKKDVEDLGEMIVNMVSKISEMSEDELEKISGGSLTDVAYQLPAEAKYFAQTHFGMTRDLAEDLIALPIFAGEFIAVWEGGKWLYKKGKNSWIPKLKEKFSKKKD